MRQERKAEIKAAIKKELKSLIGPLVILAIIVAAVAVIILWPEKVVEEEVIPMRGFDGDKKEYVMENDHLKTKLGLYDVEDGYSVLYFNLSGLIGLVINWHKNGYNKSIEDLAELIARLMAKPKK